MDFTAKKLTLEADGICKHDPNGIFAQKHQRHRSLSQARVEMLRQEQEVAKAWRDKLAKDIIDQKSAIRHQQTAVKQSHDFGGPRYKHHGPPAGEKMPVEYTEAARNLRRFKDDSANSAKQMQSLELDLNRTARRSLRDADNILKGIKGHARPPTDEEGSAPAATGVNCMADWFARYGEPKRKAELEERQRTVTLPPRRLPNFDRRPDSKRTEPLFSEARSLRLGAAVWNDNPRGTWVFRRAT